MFDGIADAVLTVLRGKSEPGRHRDGHSPGFLRCLDCTQMCPLAEGDDLLYEASLDDAFHSDVANYFRFDLPILRFLAIVFL